jgi:hypothetical protein
MIAQMKEESIVKVKKESIVKVLVVGGDERQRRACDRLMMALAELPVRVTFGASVLEQQLEQGARGSAWALSRG